LLKSHTYASTWEKDIQIRNNLLFKLNNSFKLKIFFKVFNIERNIQCYIINAFPILDFFADKIAIDLIPSKIFSKTNPNIKCNIFLSVQIEQRESEAVCSHAHAERQR